MPHNSQEPPSPDGHQARSISAWVVVVVEAVAVLGLAAGAGWFVNTLKEGAALVSLLQDPGLWVLVIAATALGALGNLALYYLGQRGAQTVFERFPGLEGERWARIGAYYQRYGAKLLILSAVPGLGTLLTTGAGAFDIKRNAFLIWVFLGKLLRNWLIVFLIGVGFQNLLPA